MGGRGLSFGGEGTHGFPWQERRFFADLTGQRRLILQKMLHIPLRKRKLEIKKAQKIQAIFATGERSPHMFTKKNEDWLLYFNVFYIGETHTKCKSPPKKVKKWKGIRERSSLQKGWGTCVCIQRVLRAPSWKWKYSPTVPIPGHCERAPESWTSPLPSLLSGGFSSRIWRGGGSAIWAQNSPPVRQDVAQRKEKGSSAFSSISSTTDGEISWVLMKLGVTCHMWMDDGRFCMSFAEKKSSEKLEENLSTEASTWNYFRRGNQHLWSHCHLCRPFRRQLSYQPSSQGPFRKKHPPSVWEGREFCRATPRQRSSAHGRSHRPVARKFRIKFYFCARLAHWLSRFVAHGLFGGWNFQAPTLEAEGTQREGTETGHGPGVVKSVYWCL